jgi:hypothetical protein
VYENTNEIQSLKSVTPFSITSLQAYVGTYINGQYFLQSKKKRRRLFVEKKIWNENFFFFRKRIEDELS